MKQTLVFLMFVLISACHQGQNTPVTESVPTNETPTEGIPTEGVPTDTVPSETPSSGDSTDSTDSTDTSQSTPPFVSTGTGEIPDSPCDEPGSNCKNNDDDESTHWCEDNPNELCID